MKTNTATLQTPHTMPRFRHFLQSELARRCTRNPQYSLRAFAKYLQIEPATLSQLLRGTRKTTPASIRKLGMRLGSTKRQSAPGSRARPPASKTRAGCSGSKS